MSTIGSAWYDLDARDSKLREALSKAEADIKKSGATAEKAFGDDASGGMNRAAKAADFLKAKTVAIGVAAGGLALGAIQGATSAIVGGFVSSINAARDLAENVNKVKVVFGAATGSVEEFAKNAASNLGLSESAALGALGTFGNLFTAMGIGVDKAAGMSKQTLQLAADLASFNNIPVDVALEKIRSGLVGEIEPLRSVGVNLTATSVAAKAVEMGLAKSTTQVSAAAKAQAAMALITEQTTNAQGDFARTSDGLANSQRILSAKLEDLSAKLGKALLPVVLAMVQGALKLIEGISKVATSIGEWAQKNHELFESLGQVMGFIADVVFKTIAEIVTRVEGAITAVINFARASELLKQGQWEAAGKVVEVAFEGMDRAMRGTAASAEQEAKRIVKQHGSIAGAATDAAMAAHAASERMDAGLQSAAAGMQGSSTQISGALDQVGIDAVAKLEAAADAAKAAAARIPSEVAAGILEGRDAVISAATGLGKAALDPLLEKANIAEIRQQMSELANVTADEISKATPATVAADKAKYAQLEIDLAGHLLRQDPKSKEAANLLAKYANSADPATRAAYDALMSAVSDRSEILANDVEADSERAGISLQEALDRHRQAATEAAEATRQAAKERLDKLQYDGTAAGDSGAQAFADAITQKAYLAGIATGKAKTVALAELQKLLDLADGYGFNTIAAYAAGMERAKYLVGIAAINAAGQGVVLRATSPPGPESPLHDIDKWGYNTLAAWADGALRASSRVRSAVLSTMSGATSLFATPVLAPAVAAGGGASAMIGGSTSAATGTGLGAAQVTNHYHNSYLTVEGQRPIVSSAQEILAQQARQARISAAGTG